MLALCKSLRDKYSLAAVSMKLNYDVYCISFLQTEMAPDILSDVMYFYQLLQSGQ